MSTYFETSVAVADTITAIAYFTIPIQIFYYGVRFKIQNNVVTWLFIAFIFLCGCTHFLQVFAAEAVKVWALGIFKWMTAIVSALCAMALFKVVPRIAGMEHEITHLQKNMLEFTSFIFHEMRGSLNVLVTGLNVLAQPANGRDIQPLIRSMNNSAIHMKDVMDDILDLRKLESGKFTINKNYASIDEIVQIICDQYQEMAERKGLQFEVDCGNCRGHAVHVDRKRCIQIFTNLVSNAVKYTDAGSVKFSLQHDGVNLVGQVTDTGCGIDRETQKRLFNIYSQSRTARCGTGLGLAISKQLVELHQGTLTMDTSEHGTTFTVTIPAEFVDRRMSNYEVVISIPDILAQGIQILIVDDDQSSCEILQEYLGTIKGFTVQTSTSGVRALELLKHDTFTHLIIDENMPDMQGTEVITELRKTNNNIRIISLSGSSSDDKIRKAGADHILQKPVSLSDLDELLKIDTHC